MAAQSRVVWDLSFRAPKPISAKEQEKIDTRRELEEALSECQKRGPTQDELNAVATAKATIKAGSATSRKKPRSIRCGCGGS